MKKEIVFTKVFRANKIGSKISLSTKEAKILVDVLGVATYGTRAITESPVVKNVEVQLPAASTPPVPPVPPTASTPPIPPALPAAATPATPSVPNMPAIPVQGAKPRTEQNKGPKGGKGQQAQGKSE